jgi:hypothetical protein
MTLVTVTNSFFILLETYVEEMLNKLEAEIGINTDVYTDDQSNESTNFTDYLYGVHAATKMSDILNQNIHIELVNSQIKMNLKQLSTIDLTTKTQFNEKLDTRTNAFDQQSDYLIISAAKTNLFHRVHKPVLKSQRLMDKFSWTGHVNSMQYFATLPMESMNSDKIQVTSDDYWLDASAIDPIDFDNTNFLETKTSGLLKHSIPNCLYFLEIFLFFRKFQKFTSFYNANKINA